MIRPENSFHFLNQPDANLKINCDFVTRAFPRFKLYACFLFKFSLAPRTFSFLLVDRRDYYASVCPFERFQTSLKKIWKTSEEFRGCSEDFRRCSEEFRECSEDFRSSHILTCCNLFSDRYAFTPIVDFGDEEDEDENMTLSDAFGESRKTLLYGCNPLHTNICMHILYTVLHSSPKVLERRLSLTINSFFSLWSFLVFSWP